MNGYELKLDQFKGPLEKLLELIEAKELEVTEVSLAEVTADFLKYVESLEHVSPRTLADFVVVAARLLLIKSHAILPHLELTEEEEEDIEDLQNRLRLYREFRKAEEHLKEQWQKEASFAREYLVQFPEGFYLTEPLSPKELERHIARMHKELEAFMPRTESVEIKLVSLEEKIEELIARVDKALTTSFNEVAAGKGRPEIIVLFLAVLHLLKDSRIEIEQEGLFSEIHIKRQET